MNFKKITALLLAVALTAACVTGCSGDADSSQADGSSAASTPEKPDFVSDPAVRISIENNKFIADGNELFMNGMNTPWNNWNDFGGEYNLEYWDNLFAKMNENGMNSARVWITCNGDVGINIDDKGMVTGATDKHWQDLDSFFQVAQKNKIYIMATLISFDHFKDQNKNYMKWRSMIQSDEAIDSYVNNYVKPFCERYDDNEYLWSIDLCNEPDWVYENQECGKLSWDYLGNYFARTAAAIHENSDILVTVGFGMIKYNSEKYEGNYGSDEFLKSCFNNENAYLDFNSTHYYSWQASSFSIPFSVSPEEFGMDMSKPMVIGECETTGVKGIAKPIELKDCYKWCYENGWSGIMPWTTDGTEPYGEFVTNVLPAVEYFNSLKNSK